MKPRDIIPWKTGPKRKLDRFSTLHAIDTAQGLGWNRQFSMKNASALLFIAFKNK